MFKYSKHFWQTAWQRYAVLKLNNTRSYNICWILWLGYEWVVYICWFVLLSFFMMLENIMHFLNNFKLTLHCNSLTSVCKTVGTAATLYLHLQEIRVQQIVLLLLNKFKHLLAVVLNMLLDTGLSPQCLLFTLLHLLLLFFHNKEFVFCR